MFLISTSFFHCCGLEPGCSHGGARGDLGGGFLSIADRHAAVVSTDREDGTADLFALSPVDPAWLALAKAGANWCVFGLPLVLLSPLLAASYGMEGLALLVLPATLALGTPALILLATVAAALTAGLRRGVGLLALLVLPLSLPVLLLGSGERNWRSTDSGRRPLHDAPEFPAAGRGASAMGCGRRLARHG